MRTLFHIPLLEVVQHPTVDCCQSFISSLWVLLWIVYFSVSNCLCASYNLFFVSECFYIEFDFSICSLYVALLTYSVYPSSCRVHFQKTLFIFLSPKFMIIYFSLPDNHLISYLIAVYNLPFIFMPGNCSFLLNFGK